MLWSTMKVVEIILLHPYISSGIILGVYLFTTILQRLVFHPLAKFPGPRIAGLSFWYQFYHNFIKDGTYVFRIQEMHEKYGPIVRITPTELHINDPSFIPELMPAGGRRRDKYEREMRLFGFSAAAGSTGPHDLHRKRRAAMTKMFSKESIRRLEPIMSRNLDILFSRLDQLKGGVFEALPAFGAFTNDIISEYAYGESSGWMESGNFNKPFFTMLDGFHDGTPLAVHFWWFFPLTNAIPEWLFLKLNPGFASIVDFRKKLMESVHKVERSRDEKRESKTIFDEIFDSKLPDAEKSEERLLAEAQNISIAGTATTAWTLTVMMVYLITHTEVLGKLKGELQEAMPNSEDIPPLKTAENLPYLSAVVHEVLRFAVGVSSRQTRIAPDENLRFDDGQKTWEIPAGTPVGMSTPIVHFDPKVFHEPNKFDPERFIRDPNLRKCVMSFSNGSRQCLGIQLAYAEIYLVMATLWRRYGAGEVSGEKGRLELYETGLKDVKMVSDRFIPYPDRQSKGVKIRVVK